MSDTYTRGPGEPFIVEGIALAPFTDDQVINLNAWQEAVGLQAFSCVNGCEEFLVATTAGWVCIEPGCEYRQNWAWVHMADGSRLNGADHG